MRHATLRTTFTKRGDDPMQKIHKQQQLCFEQIDASQWTWDNLSMRVSDAYKRPFDLEVGPVLRAHLFTRAVDDHVLLLTVHHIVCDAWSLWLLLDELQVLYPAQQQGITATLPNPVSSYKDYVCWQNQMLASPEGERLWAYWQRQLSGELPVLNLPTDRPRPPVQTYKGASHSFKLTAELTERLRRLSQAEGATLCITLVAAFLVLLHRHTAQKEILLGFPTSSRGQTDFAGIVGDFMNPVVLRGSFTEHLSFKAFLTQVRQTVLDALAYKDFPFSLLVERLQLDRDPSRSPVFEVLFNWLEPQQFREAAEMWRAGETGEQVEWGGLVLEPFAIAQQEGQLDLTLEMVEGQASLFGLFKYNPDLFEAATIERMADHFQILLEGIVAHPEQRIAELPLLTELEYYQLLVQWNETQASYPRDQYIHQLFEDQVQRTPETIAVVFADQSYTYRQLNARADELARRLQDSGVGKNELVGLCVERSLEMLVGLVGILKAGAAYLFLDPYYPQKRLDFILRDAGITVLVTQPEELSKLLRYTTDPQAYNSSSVKEQTLKGPNLQIVRLNTHQVDHQNVEIHGYPDEVQPNNPAYVIYTSGSTGVPKGVQISHQAVVNFLTSMAREPGMTEQDTMLAVTTLTFDIAVLELLLPLMVGGRVVIVKREVAMDGWKLAELLHNSGATIMQATPATWRLLIESGWQGQPNLKILCGGEALSSELARGLISRGSSLWNMYGPTETTIWSTTARVASADQITIGRPIANTELYVLDEGLQPVPIGIPGELYIGGDGLAMGYLHRPELTAQRFVSHRFRKKPGARLYKTGDIVAYTPDGQLRYLGREDRQVKIRGYRIELSEVEAAISRFPAVSAVAVMARDIAPGEKQLVAYVVVNQERWLSTTALQNALQAELPDYMVPAIFVALEKFPLTPSGKIDWNALPLPTQRYLESEAEYDSPQTLTETILGEVWSAVLRLERVSVEDNLFHLGGHSLTCVQLASEISNRLSVQLPIAMFFQYPTIRKLSKVIEEFKDTSNHAYNAQGKLIKDITKTSNTHGDGNYSSESSSHREFESPKENLFGGIKNRILQLLARIAPLKLRATFHRWRGVHIGSNVYIGYDVIIETAYPWLVSIGNDSGIGIRGMIIGHFIGMEKASLQRGDLSIEIGDKVWLGPGVLILPNVKIGDGAVVAAGSTVTTSIPAGTFAQGNPAKPIAKCGIPLVRGTSYEEFIKHLEPLETF
jgi:amino acid adenylation domain-containing protein